MKILKIFGVVVGVHVLALILIFASPGCSSAKKANNIPSETVIQRDSGPGDASNGATAANNSSPVSAAPFDPNAPAVAFDPNATAAPIRFAPTRPGTPTAGALEAQPVSDVTPATTYTVAKGDSLWTIAKKNHISVAELAVANNLKAASTVRVGQKLIIPSKASPTVNHAAAEPVAVTKASASDMKPAPRASGESVKHVVKSGETLGVIARKYQVSVGEIATANNISDPKKIRPGMELVIPGWQAPSGKKSGTAKASSPSPAANTAPATPPAQTPATNVPTLVIPPPGQDLDSGLQNKNDEAPVIKVDDK
jgi:LysM repeat protein